MRFFGNAEITDEQCREMLTPTNFYILNLAAADCIFLIGAPLQVNQSLHPEWALGNTVCTLYLGLSGVSQFVSAMLIGLLSLDRFICVCRSKTCCIRIRTRTSAIITSFAAWILVIISQYPIFKYSAVRNVETETGLQKKCMIFVSSEGDDNVDLNSLRRTFFIYTFTLEFLAPMASVWIFYAAIIWKLWRKGLKSSERTRRVTITGMSIVLCYTACWTPYWIVQWCIELSLCDYETVRNLSYAANGLQYINCSINPCLYVFLSTPFKNSFKLFRERLKSWRSGQESAHWDQEKLSEEVRGVTHEPADLLIRMLPPKSNDRTRRSLG